MRDIFSVLIPISLVVVAAVLVAGLFALFKGGAWGRSNSNKLMRLRVLTQAIAVAVLVAAFWWRTRS